MKKALRKKMDAAIARAPAPGECPMAPPRKLLFGVIALKSELQRMNDHAITAVRKLDKTERALQESKALYLAEFLKAEDLAMRLQHLESKST